MVFTCPHTFKRFGHAHSRAQPLAWPVTVSAAGGGGGWGWGQLMKYYFAAIYLNEVFRF